MKDGFKFFSLLLVAVLLIKVSAFHIYEEHSPAEDPGDHCELCLIAIDSLQLEGVDPAPVVVPNAPITALLSQLQILPQHALALKGEAGQLFSRPPPAQRA